MGEKSFKDKFKFVIRGIDLDDNKLKVSHYSIFILKRFVLIMIPTIIRGRQGLQAMLLLHMSCLYGAYVLIVKPFDRRYRKALEIFNAFIFYFIAMITYTFTDFNTNLETQLYISMFMLGVIGLFILLNMAYIIRETYHLSKMNKLRETKVKEHEYAVAVARMHYRYN